MIGPISATTYTYPTAGTSAIGQSVNPVNKVNAIAPVGQKGSIQVNKVEPSECQTCKERKYQDVSNENNVSYQAPTHIAPSASFGAVSAHEQEHVSNAVSKGNQPGNQLLSTSVTLKMGICPECGTPYVEGGTTRSTIKYNVSNPYESSRKAFEENLLKGMYVDYVA